MAEVLSQKQIDSLLNALQSDDVDLDNVDSKDTSRKIRSYDFRSPKKFTKDRIKIIDSVYDNYTKAISSYISTLLRYGCEIKVKDIEEERYNEFCNALNDNDVISLLNVSSQEDPLMTGSIIIQMSKAITYSIIDRSLGGTGNSNDIDKNYTDIELKLYEHVMKNITQKMADVWKNHVDVDIDFARTERNLGLVQITGVDEVVVIIVLEVSMKKPLGNINICIPINILETIFKLFDSKSISDGIPKDIKREKHDREILSSIKGSELDISAILGRTTIDLSDLYNLQVGDVIQIDKNKDDDVELHIGDKVWFEGSLGVAKQNLAIKINNVCSE